MKNYSKRGLAWVVGSLVLAVGFSVTANAASLHQGSAGQSGTVTGSLPGAVLWGYYQTNDSEFGYGDSILRLINPNGAANGNLAGAREQTVCAMIYVFDEDQEMGECCGCPLSSAKLNTFSAYKNLTSNWSLPLLGEDVCQSDACGSVAIVASAPNALPTCTGQSGACNGGCDPTNVPGYSVTTASNLLGSFTHNQGINTKSSQLTEIGLFDDAGGDPTNLIYLQNQCGALIGNGSGSGFCNCPNEVPLTPLVPASSF